MTAIRETFGEGRSRMSYAPWARELGEDIHRNVAREWETKGRAPDDGEEGMAARFGRLRGVQRAGVDPVALAAWYFRGVGAMPGSVAEEEPPPQPPREGRIIILRTIVDGLHEHRITKAEGERALAELIATAASVDAARRRSPLHPSAAPGLAVAPINLDGVGAWVA